MRVVTQSVTFWNAFLSQRVRRSWLLPAGGGLAVLAAFAVVFGIAKNRPSATADATPVEPRPSNQGWVASNARGKAFAAWGEPERALAEFNQAISHNPGHAVLYANRGGAKLQMGDLQGAVSDCSLAIEMDPRCVEGLLNRAHARKELGDWAAAADDYASALQNAQPSDFLWKAVKIRLEEAQRRASRKTDRERSDASTPRHHGLR